MIIHSGPGAEFTGDPNDIWSHKWGISPQSRDGKLISSYAMMPEYWSSPGDITIGVFTHELGHVLGLDDNDADHEVMRSHLDTGVRILLGGEAEDDAEQIGLSAAEELSTSDLADVGAPAALPPEEDDMLVYDEETGAFIFLGSDDADELPQAALDGALDEWVAYVEPSSGDGPPGIISW